MTDLVNHPPHYQTPAGIEAIEVMEQYGLGLHLGNAMKYLLRAGRKGDAVTDLGKAEWYVKRWLDGVESRHGVDLPSGCDSTTGGLCWRTPEQIAAAFSLTGPHRDAVIRILDAAAFGNELERVSAALGFIQRAGT